MNHRSPDGLPVLVGSSRAVQTLRMEIALAARAQPHILIHGEVGTETETVGRLIHAQSERRDRPFVVAHCKGTPPALLRSHLFGHVRGSFPGAFRDKTGLVEHAKNGALFLNDVDELSLHTQAAILEFLQSQGPLAIDADRSVAPVRLISAAPPEPRTADCGASFPPGPVPSLECDSGSRAAGTRPGH